MVNILFKMVFLGRKKKFLSESRRRISKGGITIILII